MTNGQTTDALLKVAVVGVTVGVAATTFRAFNPKPRRKKKKKRSKSIF